MADLDRAVADITLLSISFGVVSCDSLDGDKAILGQIGSRFFTDQHGEMEEVDLWDSSC